MKWRTLFILSAIILSMFILLPFCIAFLMKKEVFYFTSGVIDSWILFWGSYIGAIISSIGVYIVAKVQIKKQYEQQMEEIRNESELLYQRDIEGYLLRNKTNKLDEMVKVADELFYQLKEIDKVFPEMINTSIWDSIDALNMTEEEKEDKYNYLFERLTNGNKRCLLLLRKLRTLSSYFPKMKEDLNDLETYLNELDREIGIIFNVEKGYKYFIKELEPEQLTFEIPSLPPLMEKLTEFIVYTLKVELFNSLREVKILAGEHFVLAKNDES